MCCYKTHPSPRCIMLVLLRCTGPWECSAQFFLDSSLVRRNPFIPPSRSALTPWSCASSLKVASRASPPNLVAHYGSAQGVAFIPKFQYGETEQTLHPSLLPPPVPPPVTFPTFSDALHFFERRLVHFHLFFSALALALEPKG